MLGKGEGWRMVKKGDFGLASFLEAHDYIRVFGVLGMWLVGHLEEEVEWRFMLLLQEDFWFCLSHNR